ncbi:hypothetical protein [Pseudomonas citronellolis]|uniref:hypothetical protein n=1 Tax=Pseudomonas citronellolis TaxID=53408 RepID=UPI00071850D2|nr:hypothetical protein [Pseudomonas citronellolis]KRV75850.1 hypothetical protein AO742_03635 [Pseudomonas citronellolis]KRW80430.1 hypothetical protein AO738_11420 [Pseudomonas citronellolis]
MGIESELDKFLESRIKEGSNKTRDIEIIKFYYGLNESPWPTLEETADRFGIGTRERIRQLLNSKFRDHASESAIPSLKGFVNILQSREYWSISELTEEIYAAGLMDRESHLKGIFNLIEDVDIDSGFDFFTPELKRATRNSFTASKDILLLKTSSIENVERLLKKAQKLPGRCGIANLNYIKEDLGEHYQLISLLIKGSPTSWVRASGDDYWYIFENRDNTIINYSEKIFGVVDICAPSRLAEAFRNALDGRTYKYPYPPSEIIEEYLKSSVYLANSESGLKFIGETTKLNKIEEDLMDFFNTRTTASFPELDRHLEQIGYGRPHILKTTNHSPLVYVDKSRGRKHYVYSLIGQKTSAQDDALGLDVYEFYLRRLRSLLDVGTDEAREQIARKEQYILQEWLFKGKTHENCAICGQKFSVKTLVTAHKKPRADCNDAERLDPYIVMPLCLMGCDYLYENMYIYVEEGEIKRGVEFSSAGVESVYIENLNGRKVDSKWILGNSSYFRSPK